MRRCIRSGHGLGRLQTCTLTLVPPPLSWSTSSVTIAFPQDCLLSTTSLPNYECHPPYHCLQALSNPSFVLIHDSVFPVRRARGLSVSTHGGGGGRGGGGAGSPPLSALAVALAASAAARRGGSRTGSGAAFARVSGRVSASGASGGGVSAAASVTGGGRYGCGSPGLGGITAISSSVESSPAPLALSVAARGIGTGTGAGSVTSRRRPYTRRTALDGGAAGPDGVHSAYGPPGSTTDHACAAHDDEPPYQRQRRVIRRALSLYGGRVGGSNDGRDAGVASGASSGLPSTGGASSTVGASSGGGMAPATASGAAVAGLAVAGDLTGRSPASMLRASSLLPHERRLRAPSVAATAATGAGSGSGLAMAAGARGRALALYARALGGGSVTGAGGVGGWAASRRPASAGVDSSAASGSPSSSPAGDVTAGSTPTRTPGAGGEISPVLSPGASAARHPLYRDAAGAGAAMGHGYGHAGGGVGGAGYSHLRPVTAGAAPAQQTRGEREGGSVLAAVAASLAALGPRSQAMPMRNSRAVTGARGTTGGGGGAGGGHGGAAANSLSRAAAARRALASAVGGATGAARGADASAARLAAGTATSDGAAATYMQQQQEGQWVHGGSPRRAAVLSDATAWGTRGLEGANADAGAAASAAVAPCDPVSVFTTTHHLESAAAAAAAAPAGNANGAAAAAAVAEAVELFSALPSWQAPAQTSTSSEPDVFLPLPAQVPCRGAGDLPGPSGSSSSKAGRSAGSSATPAEGGCGDASSGPSRLLPLPSPYAQEESAMLPLWASSQPGGSSTILGGSTHVAAGPSGKPGSLHAARPRAVAHACTPSPTAPGRAPATAPFAPAAAAAAAGGATPTSPVGGGGSGGAGGANRVHPLPLHLEPA